MAEIKNFEDLKIWQNAQALAVDIYTLTKDFPASEIYGLTNQIRRSSTSISANIAEGFGRRTKKDKLHFYTIAYGSLLETKNFIYLSQKLNFSLKDETKKIIDTILVLQKQLIVFMKPLI